MAFFEGLKNIIPAKIAEESYGFDLVLTESRSKSEINFKVNKPKKTITVYLNKLSYKEKSILEKHLKKCFNQDQLKFIESEKVDLIERLLNYNKEDDGSTLLFFKDILTPFDLNVLRDSLFLRNEFINGRNISSLKRDILMAYGERGNIISNLCSAGYFEEVMIPLYNSSQKEYYSFYDLAVDRAVKAFFVNSGMTVSKITQEIERRVASAHSSGLKSINIHLRKKRRYFFS